MNMLPIQRVRAPSVADFHRFFVKPMLPVVLVGVAAQWPAISRWCNESYLHATAGEAVVDVEVGKHFLDPQLREQRSTLSRFMRQHLHDVSAYLQRGSHSCERKLIHSSAGQHSTQHRISASATSWLRRAL